MGALLVSNGQAAETIALLNIAEAGDHIVSSPSLYGGTDNLFHYNLPKLGITVSFVDISDDPAPGGLRCGPTPRRSSAKRSPTPRTTFLTSKPWRRWPTRWAWPWWWTTPWRRPYLIRPIEWGADVVVHSATSPIPAITDWSMPGVPPQPTGADHCTRSRHP